MSVSQNFPNIAPSLSLDFANVKALDSRITFTRASSARYYNGVTTTKAEENLLQYSQEFDNAYWVKANVTVTANSTTAPDGTTTAETFAETSATGGHAVVNVNSPSGIPFTAFRSYIFSVFLKKGTGATAPNWIQLRVVDNVPAPCFVNFNLNTAVTGNVSNATGNIVSVGNDWYRCILVCTTNTSGNNGRIQVAFTNNTDTLSVDNSYAGATTSDVFVWGAQVEQRSAVTAYTPTTTQPITNYIPTLLTATDNVARFDHNPTTGESLGLLIEEQRTNLLVRSEEFDNASWGKLNTTITANTIVAPDGTLTAEKLVLDSGIGPSTSNIDGVTRGAVVTSGVYTYSVFAKAGEFTELRVRENATTGSFLNFNLSTGVAPTGSAQFVTPTMVNVGNGWYRCSWTSPAGMVNASKYTLRVNSTGDGYSGIYIWGAQLEAGAFPTSYIPTVASQVTRSADSASMTGANFSSWYRADEGTLYAEGASPIAEPSRFGVSDGTTSNRILVFSGGIVTTNGTIQAILSSGSEVLNQFQKLALAYETNDFAFTRNGGVVNTDTLGVLPVVNRAGIGQASNGTVQTQYIKRIAYYPVKLEPVQLQALTS